jgi:hypothetical protein
VAGDPVDPAVEADVRRAQGDDERIDHFAQTAGQGLEGTFNIADCRMLIAD